MPTFYLFPNIAFSIASNDVRFESIPLAPPAKLRKLSERREGSRHFFMQLERAYLSKRYWAMQKYAHASKTNSESLC